MTDRQPTPSADGTPLPAEGGGAIKVWDQVVRIGHWVLVVGFATAYVSEGEPLWLHNWAGYAIGITVAIRIVWGFVGPEPARSRDFVRGPGAVFGYLGNLVGGHARRYVGHSPAGGAMAVALLFSLAATMVTGMAHLAMVEHQGPLAPIFAKADWVTVSIVTSAAADTDDDEHADENDERRKYHDGERESPFEEIHEFFANVTLLLVACHVLGVAIASFAHRENLVAAMFTGRKRT